MSEYIGSSVPAHQSANDSKEISVLDLLSVIVAHKALVIGLPILVGAAALGVSLLLTPIFTSTTKIMPPQAPQSNGLAAVMGQLGGLAGAAGIKNPNELYVGILESRTVADNLIGRFKLQAYYEKKTMTDTRKAMGGIVEIVNSKKDGMISVSVSDKDPLFAAALANGYTEELIKLTKNLAISEASQRRLFFEKQLNEAKVHLADAEIALRNTQQKTGMIQPEAQVQAIILGAAQLKGAIAAKEVQINSMRTFATGQNPELMRAQEELRSLRGQLSALEKSRPSDGDLMVPIGKIPEIGVQYVRAMREVKYYETIFELLAKQFELAKIDEAKESSVIQILDRAIPSDKKAKPSKAKIVMAATFAGLVLALLIAFLRNAYRVSRQDPASKERWHRLSMAWNGSAGTTRSGAPL